MSPMIFYVKNKKAFAARLTETFPAEFGNTSASHSSTLYIAQIISAKFIPEEIMLRKNSKIKYFLEY
jgi:hypothetical protein